jgi:hypothetical protein
LGGGTTIASSTSKNKNLINARNFAAEKLESLYLQQTNPSSKLPNSTLSNITKEATEKYGLEEADVKLSMLKGRFRKGRAVYANGRGLNSPMICVEKLVVECIKLANSLISESVTQMELVKWKREVLGKKIRGEGAHTVGYTWRRNFVKRRKVHLSIGKAVRFDMRRNEWCKMENFETMHDFIYNNLAERKLQKYGKKRRC